MSQWFVYSDLTYYPYAEIVEAENAEAAGQIVGKGREEVAVFPIDALAFASSDDLLVDLREAGEQTERHAR